MITIIITSIYKGLYSTISPFIGLCIIKCYIFINLQLQTFSISPWMVRVLGNCSMYLLCCGTWQFGGPKELGPAQTRGPSIGQFH